MILYWDQAEKRSLWPTFEGRDSAVILKDMYAGRRRRILWISSFPSYRSHGSSKTFS